MKTIRLLLILCFAFCVVNVDAQTKRRKKVVAKSSEVVKVKSSKKITKTISAGVINGKAIDLVKPEYPKSAQAVNTYGQVVIQVLVDENGNVIFAKPISGHPLLRAASVKAAIQSKFEPMTLGGEPVRVNGIIYYNFIPSEWNWLEIGYTLNGGSSYYSFKTPLKTLPFGYEEERQLLQQMVESSENESIETIVALIRNKLTNDEKADWCFSVGLTLAKIENEWNIGGHSLRTDTQSFQDLKILVQNPAKETKTVLTDNLKKFIVFTEKNKTLEGLQTLRQLKENFSVLGR